ncbi:MAG: protein translocase subunit SecF [Bacteroidetes bacterium]|nr:protein translocase subunit SecF [Bacteroidota bacterium]
MGKRKIWYALSLSVLVIAVAGLSFKQIVYGIDFRGGTELVLRFTTPPAINELRSAIDRADFKGSEIKSYGEPTDIIIFTAEQEENVKVGDAIREEITKAFPDNNYSVLREDKIGPKIGAELRRNAIYAVFVTMLIIMIYIGFRFHFVYGVMGVVAIFHDVLATFGIIVLLNGFSPHLNLEINQTIMAAFLTLIGFSINDTVIVFDRIRENLKLFKTETLFTIINKSINETLSRTVITSGTIIIVLIVLIIFGGEVNRGFAFTFLLGTILGTYSSIYIASALVLDFSEYKKKKAKK